MDSLIRRHPYRRLVLCFDVETTGLFPKQKRGDPPPALESLPRILQLSFTVYDMRKWRALRKYNNYIHVAEDVEIPEIVTNLTGITKKICNHRGVTIVQALADFYREYMRCDCVVAHNIEFDRRMILTELARHGRALETMECPYWSCMFHPLYHKMHDIETFCTMRVGTRVCAIMRMGQRGPFLKPPKLAELFTHLFGYEPKGMHDAMADVAACLRCFIRLRVGGGKTTSRIL